MSNLAPPLPRLLKEVKHGKGQYAKRLENKDRLLGWAIEYMDIAVGDLRRSHQTPSGRIDDPEVRVEIGRLQKWLSLARTATKPEGGK